MAVQSKTLVNDVGSAVVDELASQMNRAYCTVGPTCLHSLKGDTVGTSSITHAEQNLFLMFHAAEDCLVTSVKLSTATQSLGTGTNTVLLLKLASTWKQGNDSDDSVGFDDINGSHDEAIGAGTGCDVVLCTDMVTADDTLSGFAELLGRTAESSATAVAADLFVTGNGIMGDHAATPSQDSASTVAMNAGDTLVMLLDNQVGSGAYTLFSTISYRPVKDNLALTPTFTQKTFNTKAR